MSDEFQLQLKELSQHLSFLPSRSSDYLVAEIAKAIQASKEQHIHTRAHVSEAETHITSRMQNINLSQEQAHTHRKQEQRLQQQRQTFLDSLWFDEANARRSDITASHRNTFHWMFDDDQKRPWDSFTTWLKGDQPIYWIYGKPGSGKSTLMKFLASASPTNHCLANRYPDDKVLVVAYYFWLSGSHIQRSLKGFLCSIIRQTIVNDNRLLNTLLDEHPELLEKRNINDWDPKELQTLLIRLTNLRTLPVCYFIDGLDEFDQDDDIESVLSLVEEISAAHKTKFCVSSRPENYISTHLSRRPQLRLQDLTAADMKTLICDELSNARSKCSPASIDNERMDRIVWTMAHKAEGVFLWVHYAIKSLVKGMRNEDNFEDLLNRIEDLPIGMNQLYLQMWNRLNEDQQRYRDEAATYFSYRNLGPISLFEMVIALSDSLQRMYIDCELPHGHINVVEQCEKLETRLTVRCAGLLETVIDDGNADSHYSTQYRRLAWEDSHSPIQRMSLEGHLLRHHKMKIKFIHRTARDFLFGSHEGRSLFGPPKESPSLRWQNLLKASMAVKVQGLEPLEPGWVSDSMVHIAGNCTKMEIELVASLKHLCERLSIPGVPSHNMGYQSFWMLRNFHGNIHYSPSFEGAAAEAGCEQYIQDLLQRQRYHFSPHYLGFLIFAFVQNLKLGFTEEERNLESCSYPLSPTSWLISGGADLRAKYICGVWVEDVVSCVLLHLSKVAIHLRETQRYTEISSQVAEQAAGLTKQLYAALAVSDFDCLIHVFRGGGWQDFDRWNGFDRRRHHWKIMDRMGADRDTAVVVRCSATSLCWRTAQLFDPPVSFEFQRSQPLPQRDNKTRVIFSSPQTPLGKVFNSEDSILLGQKLEDLWFTDADSSASRSQLSKIFENELREVMDRSTSMDIDDWAFGNGMKFREKDLIYTLDPSEDVDESNWREKGYFRKYDARDELHRSPEKLKMIERMQQFPDEEWGQERRFERRQIRRRREIRDSARLLKITTPSNLPGGALSEASG